MRPDSHRSPGLRIEKCGRDLPKIHQTQGAMPKPTTCRNGDPVRETTIGFDERVKPLIVLGEFQIEQFSRIQPYPNAKHLPWTEMIVQGRRLAQKRL
jgi:hypothetical protein